MCVLPVVQFSTEAFASYAHETFAGVLFGSVAKHLRFFRYFWEFNAFIFVLLAVMLATAIYLVRCPSLPNTSQSNACLLVCCLSGWRGSSVCVCRPLKQTGSVPIGQGRGAERDGQDPATGPRTPTRRRKPNCKARRRRSGAPIDFSASQGLGFP